MSLSQQIQDQALVAMAKYPWRLGQAMVNVLHDVNPAIYGKFLAESHANKALIDPFYDNKKIHAFLAWIEENSANT